MARRNEYERRICQQIARLLALAGMPGVVWFHVPNGEARNRVTGALLKSMGVRAGVADYVIINPHSGLVHFMEVKAGRGRQSPEQVEFMGDVQRAAAAGAPVEYAVVKGFDGALEYLARIGAVAAP